MSTPISAAGSAESAAPTHLLTEDVISIADAARELPGRPHVSTVWRYAKKGLRGKKLESLKISGTATITSRQALTRFLIAINTDGGAQ